MTIRLTRIEIWKMPADRRDRWKELSAQVQQATNMLWQYWLVFHTLNGSADKIKEDIAAYAEWQKADKEARGPKPKWRVSALPETDWKYSREKRPHNGKTNPPDLQNDLYHVISHAFEQLHSRTKEVLLSKWTRTLKTRKSARGSLPGWAAILLGNEGVPSFTRPLPIPFDSRSCPRGVPIRKDGDKYLFDVRIERTRQCSLEDSFELVLNRKKTASRRAIVDRVMSGEYTFKGSSLLHDPASGKWFAMLAYEMPDAEKPEMKTGKKLLVRPGRLSPWRVKFVDNGKEGGSFAFGGNGRHVEFARRNIQRQRDSRKEHYRFAGSSRKGRGRRHATTVWTKLSTRWKDFSKRYNNEVTRRMVDMAVSARTEKLIYFQPMVERRDSRFLSIAGNERSHAMYWDYFQFGTMLQQKCERAGIEFVIVKEVPKKQPKEVSTHEVVKKVIPSRRKKEMARS